MMTKEASTKIVNFMTPSAGVLVVWRGHISHLFKMLNFIKIYFFLPCIDPTNWVYGNDELGRFYQNCKFRTCARTCQSKMLHFIKKSFNILLGIWQTNWIMKSKEFNDPKV